MTETPPSEDPTIGRVVAGKYRVDAVVGSGASGTVYRATHVVLGRPLALKALNPALLADETARARFRREARAASKLDHPNSVQVLDYGTEPDGMTYLAMELLEGRDLYRVIYEDWPLGTERIARIMSQVLSVLAAAHEAGIVHRDLKPENIMLVERPGDDGRPTEVVKVADFGIAKTVAGTVSEESLNLTREGTVHGTPEYMSPEQARGEEVDGRTDLYACGVVLYEMLAGQLPFTGDGTFDVILQHVTAPVVPPSLRRGGVDRRLEPVVLRALAKRREDRYPDARAMRGALLEALAQPPPPGSSSQPAPPPVDPRATAPTVPAAATHPASAAVPASAPPGLSDADEPVKLPLSRGRRWALAALGGTAAAAVAALLYAGLSSRGPVARAVAPAAAAPDAGAAARDAASLDAAHELRPDAAAAPAARAAQPPGRRPRGPRRRQ